MQTKQNKTRKVISLVLILVVLLALVGFGAWSALKPKTTAVELSKAERGTLVQNLTIKANLEAIDTFETSLGLSAKVIKIEKREGDTVMAGDVLVRLDTADLQYQLDRATISLDQLKLSTENARAQAAISLDSASLSYEQAKKNYEDVRKKYNNGTATRLMRDQAETAMKTAENQVKLAQATFDGLDLNAAGSERKRQIDAATLEIENLKRKIDDSVVRSAISGVVTILEVREDQFPTQSNSQVQVMDLSKLLLKADVDQNDVVRIKTGQPATIKVKGLVKSYSGSVSQISSVAASDQVNSSEPKYEVTIILDPSSDQNQETKGVELKPGYEADASVTVEEKADSLSVMQSAVQIRNGQAFVWVAVNGVASQKPVKTGLRSDKRIEILEGLQDGDMVILYPPAELTEGSLVIAS